MNAKRLINVIKTTMQRIKKDLILKKAKVKIINNFIASKKTLNAKASEKDEDYAQLILHRCIMNEFFKNDYRS